MGTISFGFLKKAAGSAPEYARYVDFVVESMDDGERQVINVTVDTESDEGTIVNYSGDLISIKEIPASFDGYNIEVGYELRTITQNAQSLQLFKPFAVDDKYQDERVTLWTAPEGCTSVNISLPPDEDTDPQLRSIYNSHTYQFCVKGPGTSKEVVLSQGDPPFSFKPTPGQDYTFISDTVGGLVRLRADRGEYSVQKEYDWQWLDENFHNTCMIDKYSYPSQSSAVMRVASSAMDALRTVTSVLTDTSDSESADNNPELEYNGAQVTDDETAKNPGIVPATDFAEAVEGCESECDGTDTVSDSNDAEMQDNEAVPNYFGAHDTDSNEQTAEEDNTPIREDGHKPMEGDADNCTKDDDAEPMRNTKNAQGAVIDELRTGGHEASASEFGQLKMSSRKALHGRNLQSAPSVTPADEENDSDENTLEESTSNSASANNSEEVQSSEDEDSAENDIAAINTEGEPAATGTGEEVSYAEVPFTIQKIGGTPGATYKFYFTNYWTDDTKYILPIIGEEDNIVSLTVDSYGFGEARPIVRIRNGEVAYFWQKGVGYWGDSFEYTTEEKQSLAVDKDGTVSLEGVPYPDSEQENELTVTNTYIETERELGELRLSKEVKGRPTNESFRFKVMLYKGDDVWLYNTREANLAWSHHRAHFTNGVTEIELKDGESHSIINLPTEDGGQPISYSIEEVETNGYTVVVPKNAKGPVNGGVTNVNFVNAENGSLALSKTVAGGDPDSAAEFSFEVTLLDSEGEELADSYSYSGDKSGTISSGGTVALKDGDQIVIEGLPVGTQYTVTETPLKGYTAVSPAGGTETGTISAAAAADVEFTNIKNGSLALSKTVVDGDPDSAAEFSFEVTLLDSEGEELAGSYSYSGDKSGTISSGGTVVLKDGDQIVIEGLPVGTQYTVTETPLKGYTAVSPAGGTETGEVTANTVSVVEFVNKRLGEEPTPTPTVTPVPTPSPSETPNSSPSATPSTSPTPSTTRTPEPTPSLAPTPTRTPEPSPSTTASATRTPESSPSTTASATRTPEPSPSTTASATRTPEPDPVETPTATLHNTPSPTPRPSDSQTPQPTSTSRPRPIQPLPSATTTPHSGTLGEIPDIPGPPGAGTTLAEGPEWPTDGNPNNPWQTTLHAPPTSPVTQVNSGAYSSSNINGNSNASPVPTAPQTGDNDLRPADRHWPILAAALCSITSIALRRRSSRAN